MRDIYATEGGFARSKLPVVGAFHNLLMDEIPKKFPKLRWGFIEVSAQWLPYAYNDLDLRFKAGLAASDPRMNCALLTEPPQVQTLTRLADCRAPAMLPARSSVATLEPMRRSGTCTYFFLTRH